MALARSSAANKGATNHYNVKDVKSLDYSSAADNGLTTKVYHGVSITSGGSSTAIIGRVQSWQPDSYTREGIHLYELANISFGRPVEYIPGKTTGFTIAVTRAEVWYAEMEKAFGFTSTFDDLIDQRRPFTVKEWWFRGDSAYHVWEYRGCWFTSKNLEAITSDGDGVTKISATLAYVSRKRVVGAAN